LQLDDGSSLMFYAMRRTGGTRDPASAGTYVDSSGVERALRDEDVRLSVGKQWQSPRGGVYPAEWRLQVPSLGLEMQLRPVLADQELDTTPRYWEGAVDVVGSRSGAALLGRGYVELTGYANAAGDARMRASQRK
jgi:predicted secreted hydrolase